MARVKLTILENYNFLTKIPIRIYDLNYGVHAGIAEVVNIIHEVRYQLFKSLGVDELNLGDGKTAIVISDFLVNMHQEILIGEDLEVHSHIADFQTKGFRVYHKICRSEEVYALVETGLVTVDREKKQATPVPQEFISLINKS